MNKTKMFMVLLGFACLSSNGWSMENDQEIEDIGCIPSDKNSYKVTFLKRVGDFLFFNNEQKCKFACTKFLLDQEAFILYIEEKNNQLIPCVLSFPTSIPIYGPPDYKIQLSLGLYLSLMSYLSQNRQTEKVAVFLSDCGYDTDEFFAKLDELDLDL